MDFENSKIGLIAGNGQFPLIFAKKAREKNLSVYCVAFINEADLNLKNNVDKDKIEWIYLGQIGKLVRFFHTNNIKRAVMLGGIKKTNALSLSNIKPDMKALSLAAKIALSHTHDDNVLKIFADFLEKESIKISSPDFLLPDILAIKGLWTKRKLTKAEESDVEMGLKIALEIGKLDIGQCIVLFGGSVVAIEAIEGTDSAITRGGLLCNKKGAVVVKICKPNQDTRFDIPAVGVQTIKTMAEVNAKVLAIQAQKTVVFDKQDMIDLANELNISIIAL